ncbi:MAG: hypothetical protein ACKVW3_11260 [Phycisphaerales bacterium]
MNARTMMMVVMVSAGTAWAQPPVSEPKSAPPKQEPAKQDPPGQAEPTLDELLGLKEAGKAGAAPDPSRQALDQKLSAKEAEEQYDQAVRLMGDVAERLVSASDAGLDTQRMQESILRKLDQLIKQAEQNRQKSKSKSKSKSKQQQQNQEQQEQPDQASQQESGKEPGSQAAPNTAEPPPGQGAAPGSEALSRGAAWGALPARVRDALVQGNADRYSALYQRWTEAYYKKLAREEKP